MAGLLQGRRRPAAEGVMIRWYHHFNNRMALAFTFLAMLVLAVTGYVTFRFYGAEYLASISAQQHALVSRVAVQLDQQLRFGREMITRTARRLPPELLADPQRLQEFLDNHLGDGAQIFFDNGVFVFSPSGKLVAEWPFKPDRRGLDYSFRDYFRKTVASGQPLISDPYQSSQAHRHPAVNFTAPLFADDGRLAGVIAGSVDLLGENFLHGLSSITVGRSGYLYLFNRDRMMIVHPEASRTLKADVPQGVNQLFDAAIAGFDGTGETVNSRGITMLASFRHLSETNWILAANYPREEAFAPLIDARNRTLVVLVVLLFAGGLVIWLLSVRITTPLKRLTAAVRTADHATGPLQLGISGNGEVAVLADSFEALMTEISHQRALAAEQLRFLQTIIDTIPSPVYYQSPERRITGCNASFALVVDRTVAEIVGKSLDEVLPEAVAVQVGCSDNDLVPCGDEVTCSFEMQCPIAGEGRNFLVFKAIFRDASGAPGGVVGTLIDITEHRKFEQALGAQKQFFEDLLQNSAVACFVLDPRHRIVTWTRACEELTGLSAAEMVGTDRHWEPFYPSKRPCLADLLIDNSLDQVLDLYDQYSCSRLVAEGIQAEGWYENVGGHRRYLYFEAAPVRDSTGKLVAVIETLQDISSLKHVEKALLESEQSHRSLIDRSPDAIVVHRGGIVVFANQAAARLFAADSAAQLKDLDLLGLIAPEFRSQVAQRIDLVERNQIDQLYAEEKIVRLDGRDVDVETSSTPVYFGGAWSVQTILRDITERKEQQEQVWRQANFDALTQIPNRMLFNDRLRQTVELSSREGQACALMYIDLDGFKAINDTLGHDAGDLLLREAARRLLGAMRKSDTVARLGGDEFAMVIPNVSGAESMSVVAARILRLLARPFDLGGVCRQISASVGIALYPTDADDIPSLVKCADRAMYCAKQGGKNSFRFCSDAAVAATGGG